MKKNQLAATILLVLGLVLTATVTAQDDNRQVDESSKKIFTERSKEIVDDFAPLSVFVVNDNGDATDAVPGDGICETAASNGICTLRAAVGESNALAGNDTITFDSGVTSVSVNGQIAISSNISIIGNGASSLTIQNTAALSTTSRVFNVTNFIVSLSGMTITGGNLTGSGGGILNSGNLTITNCVVTNNMASSTGGGIRSTNTLTIHNSVVSNNASTASTSGGISFAGANLTVRNTTISGNTSSGNGGGMNISASASATISNSTISGNTAGASSGGFFTNRGTITNTTISGNTANGAAATDGGGGVRIQAGANSVSFISSTIMNNTAPNSASGARSGIWHETGTVNLSNSIVAGNVAQDIQRDGGTLTSGGFNLIGENTSVATEFPEGQPNASNDYAGTDAMPINPMLAALADNGGATETHALLKGSLAIDKGNAFSLDVDQRGYLRTIDLPIPNTPMGDGTDIGAFEFQSTPNTAGFSVSGRVSDGFGSGVSRVLVVLTDDEGNVSGAVTNSFGNFRFENVAAGESYVVSVQSKEHQFTPQVITVNDDVTGLTITALP